VCVCVCVTVTVMWFFLFSLWFYVNIGQKFFYCIPADFCPLLDGVRGGLVAEWLACWTLVQKGLGSYSSRYAVR